MPLDIKNTHGEIPSVGVLYTKTNFVSRGFLRLRKLRIGQILAYAITFIIRIYPVGGEFSWWGKILLYIPRALTKMDQETHVRRLKNTARIFLPKVNHGLGGEC